MECLHRLSITRTANSERPCLAGCIVKIFRCELYGECTKSRYKDGQSERICMFCDQQPPLPPPKPLTVNHG